MNYFGNSSLTGDKVNMCLIVFNWQPSEKRMLTLASNRDEFYARPSQNAHFWDDYPNIFGGRDLKMKGTWLATSKNMRLAAITNYRSPSSQTFSRSRGEIPFLFLNSTLSAIDYAQKIPKREFAGFNVILFDGKDLVYCHNQKNSSNEYDAATILPAGHYGLSNHLLNTPWPKVKKTKNALEKIDILNNNAEISQHLLSALQNTETANDNQLPNTGVGLGTERLLSSAFITSPVYGTRTSTIIIVEKLAVTSPYAGQVFFHERQYLKNVNQFNDQVHTITSTTLQT